MTSRLITKRQARDLGIMYVCILYHHRRECLFSPASMRQDDSHLYITYTFGKSPLPCGVAGTYYPEVQSRREWTIKSPKPMRRDRCYRTSYPEDHAGGGKSTITAQTGRIACLACGNGKDPYRHCTRYTAGPAEQPPNILMLGGKNVKHWEGGEQIRVHRWGLGRMIVTAKTKEREREENKNK